jgi:hypothetical protein
MLNCYPFILPDLCNYRPINVGKAHINTEKGLEFLPRFAV